MLEQMDVLFTKVFDLFKDTVEKKERKYNPVFRVESILHTKDKDLRYTDGFHIRDLVIVRDYVNNIGDVIEGCFSIPLGTFIYDVYDYLDNVEITLKTEKQFYKTSNGVDSEPVVTVDRYKAVYLKDKNGDIPNNKDNSKDDLNQQLPFVVYFQLIDTAVESVRIKTTGGNFALEETDLKDIVRNVISTETSNILVNNKPPIDFIQIEKFDNEKPIQNLVIPSYTRIIEIPDYIQEKSVGLYNAGLGCYIQKYTKKYEEYKKGFWVYSLYNPDKEDHGVYDIYGPNNSAYSNTYPSAIFSPDDDKLKILCSKITTVDADKETAVMSEGSGFRTAKAESMMTKPVTIRKGGPVFERNKLNTEVVYKEREDNMNFAVNKGVYFNNFTLSTEVFKRQGNYIHLECSNLDHDVISPGKIANIVYKGSVTKDGKTTKKMINRNGIVHRAIFSYSNSRNNYMFSRNSRLVDLTSQASLDVFVGVDKNDKEDASEDTQETSE